MSNVPEHLYDKYLPKAANVELADAAEEYMV